MEELPFDPEAPINILSLPYIKEILFFSALIIIGQIVVTIVVDKEDREKRYRWKKNVLTGVFIMVMILIILPWFIRWGRLLSSGFLAQSTKR